MLAHRTQKKEPITPEILKNLVDKLAFPEASLSSIRVVTLCLMGFAGFLRFNEMANIKEADIQIFSDYLELFIESSKADQYRDGARIIIERSEQNTCPVGMLERYMQLGNIRNSPELPLFRGIMHTRSGEQLRKKGGISYIRVREIVLEKLSEFGLDWKQFGLHSLRSGGASAAACAGVPDRLFKCHRYGAVKMQKMAMSRIQWKTGCQYQRELVSDQPIVESTFDPTCIQCELTCVMITCTYTIVTHFLCPLTQLPDTKYLVPLVACLTCGIARAS